MNARDWSFLTDPDYGSHTGGRKNMLTLIEIIYIFVM
jgi:hypothetical protein